MSIGQSRQRHKYAAAVGSFCFVTTENGEQQDIYNLTTIPGVQRLEEVIDDSSSTRVELPNGVDNETRDMLERCVATCGKAAGARAKMRKISGTIRRVSRGSTRILQAVC